MTIIAATDLTQRPPRSVRARLGGYALLPRMLDKARATVAGTNGEYHFNCPLDQHIINYLGIDPIALQEQVATGKGDGEMLEWINANAKHLHAAYEIEQWSDFQEKRGPSGDAGTYGFFGEYLSKLSTTREDIASWADLLDLDDHVSFGGKA